MEEPQKCMLIPHGREGKVIYFLLLSALLVSIFLYLAGKTVFLVDGEGEGQKYFTFSRTVEEFINETDISLGPDDQLHPTAEQPLKQGDVVFIRRAVPVILAVDGGEQEVWTRARDVTEFLRETGIHIGTGDHINPGPGCVLQPGDRVEVSRGDGEYVRRREPLPRTGEHGENTVFARGGRSFEFSRVIQVEATAYCPGTPQSGCPLDKQGHAYCTGSFNDGYTSTGAKAVAGDGNLDNPHIIAVDPAVIPLYSLVYLEEYGFARALDRGGAIRGNRIDLLFDRHKDALKFGRRQLKVYLLSY